MTDASTPPCHSAIDPTRLGAAFIAFGMIAAPSTAAAAAFAERALPGVHVRQLVTKARAAAARYGRAHDRKIALALRHRRVVRIVRRHGSRRSAVHRVASSSPPATADPDPEPARPRAHGEVRS